MVRKARKTAASEDYPPCAVEGCLEQGEFKAPLMRGEEARYQHLCLEHVRQFNQAWNYFDGWAQAEIEAFMHSSVHGHRPTWSISDRFGATHLTPEALATALHRMMGEAPPPPTRKPETKAERRLREALATLDMEPESTAAAIKSRYKKLVKLYHPDVNSSKEAEERFKRVTEAYEFIFKTYRISS